MNEKRIKNELQNTEDEIQDFQKDKMAKLNQLNVSIVLKVKQIQNLEPEETMVEKWKEIRMREQEAAAQNEENSNLNESAAHNQDEADYRGFYLPPDLSKSVLFTRSGLLGLIDRKRMLDEEHNNNDVRFQVYKDEFRKKKKEINEGEKIRQERDREYKEKQMLRFGDLVDLDNLEVSGPSAAVVDLQNKFHKKEKQCIKAIEDSEADLEKTQRDLTNAIKNNTNLLNLIISLGQKQLDLNKTLDSRNKAIFVDEDDDEKRNLVQEKQKLKELLELQAKEIETLKTEINLYKRKGGHIYTKVTTNRRVANLAQNMNE
jgi:hypothetical protein